jgi:hypothetical protein
MTAPQEVIPDGGELPDDRDIEGGTRERQRHIEVRTQNPGSVNRSEFGERDG